MGKLPYNLEAILTKLPFDYYDIVLTSIYKIIDSTEQLDIVYYGDSTIEDKRKVLFFHRVLLEDTKKLLIKLLGNSFTALELSYAVGIESQLIQTHEMLLELN